MRAFQRHGLQTGLLLIALVALPGSVVGANLSRADQAKLFSLQKKIDELNRASKYEAAIPIAQQRLAMVEKLKGSDHSDTAASYDILGELYRHAGDFSKAFNCGKQCFSFASRKAHQRCVHEGVFNSGEFGIETGA